MVLFVISLKKLFEMGLSSESTDLCGLLWDQKQDVNNSLFQFAFGYQDLKRTEAI